MKRNYENIDRCREKNLIRICPICNCNKGYVLHSQKMILPDDYLLDSNFDIVKCIQCGFIYLDSKSVQKDYDTYYECLSKYESDTTITGSGVTEGDNVRFDNISKHIEEVLNNKDASILDLGCANGGLLFSLRNRGYKNVVGLDPSKVCVSNVMNKGIKALQGNILSSELYELSKEYGGFDCIVLSNVLEHIYDLSNAIKKVIECLKDDGILCIEVPNVLKYFEYFTLPFQYFNIEHINHFDNISLNNLLLINGYSCISLKENEDIITLKQSYPVLTGFYKKKNDNKLLPDNYIYDDYLKEIDTYIEKSKENHIRINTELENMLIEFKDVVVWGTGMYTSWLLANTNLNKLNIKAFVDNDRKKQGESMIGVKIISPEQLKVYDEPIFICSIYYSDDIERQIKDDKLTNKIIKIN
ncbi:class I SAM-dependent methyltransferase [Clostridiaceae bacterium UIB06]|uniref:Class I SAM-dependent methyltransferase n=1 Tax=Clostridium thailandense TaxID=2794346 RepID=A0A949X3R9_9CLOT|nr:class I SAM-dependent methyltransferase [Clostridium thailandense]MBV7272808.1 class I SAM-dependent methyltransferase [Clostridium thailandense]MCH5137651.1 class I SAM-dependent methyltransferase [Clostridiaceae bacterium UIB06]